MNHFICQFVQRTRTGIKLPPGGWLLLTLLSFYVFAGLFGRDPWRGDDAIHISIAWQMFSTGNWLHPTLAGQFFDAPPLYYWTGAIAAHLFSWLLPLHEAIRFASAFWLALTLIALYYTGRTLYGQAHAAASPLLLAGSMGLILHAHDAQPMLIAIAAYSISICGFSLLPTKPRLSLLLYGLSIALCFLGTGILPLFPLLGIAPLLVWQSENRRQVLIIVAAAWGVAAFVALPWVISFYSREPAHFSHWLAAELLPLYRLPSQTPRFGFFDLLPWFAFPTLPLALCTLWIRRRRLWSSEWLLLSFGFLTTVLIVFCYPPREIPALLILPTLALLAAPGVLALRRGAAAAFDWFAICSFSVFILLTWVAWSAMTLGWPTKLSERVFILRPGLLPVIDKTLLLLAVAAFIAWLWLVVTTARSPYRGLIHWTLGLTLFWLSAASLLTPWFDYGKSYRPIAEAIVKHLPPRAACLAEEGLSQAQLASLAYFTKINPEARQSLAGKKCTWLIVASANEASTPAVGKEWKTLWESTHPARRREFFRLYERH